MWGVPVSRSSLRHALMKDGRWEKVQQDIAKRKARVESDMDPLPDDQYLMPGFNKTKGTFDSDKKQQYNAEMRKVRDFLRETELDPDDARTARYVSTLAEDERRFLNRRQARSLSIGHARDTLVVRQFRQLAQSEFKGVIKPSGYALKGGNKTTKRMATLHLSDLHIGARLLLVDNPEAFGAEEEARRLAWIVLQTCEFKTQYRDHTTLNLLINGDVIEGMLLHDLRDGAPLPEQMVAFVKYIAQALALLAKSFPTIHVWCQSGNHGRNKLRHEGRATSSKWESFEFAMYKMLEIMATDLKNVHWHIPQAPWVVVPLFDKAMLVTHGDTELKLSSARTKGASFEAALDKMNGNLTYGRHIDLLTVGHFHEGTVLHFKRSIAVINGALVPPNGHARASGYETACGQFLWESVPGYAFGDNRYIRVGPEQDRDQSLERIIAPVQF